MPGLQRLFLKQDQRQERNRKRGRNGEENDPEGGDRRCAQKCLAERACRRPDRRFRQHDDAEYGDQDGADEISLSDRHGAQRMLECAPIADAP